MDFELTARTRDLLDRLQVFMDDHVYPAETVYDAADRGGCRTATSSHR